MCKHVRLTTYYALLTAHCWRNYLYLLQVVKGFAVPVNLQNSLLYVGGSLFAVSSFIMLPEELPKGFLEGYTPLAALLVLFQASETYPPLLTHLLHTPTHSPPPYPYSRTSSIPLLTHLLQAFHGLAVTLVYKYADAIVKNFANATVSTY